MSELAGVTSLFDTSLSDEIVVQGRLQLGQRLHAAYQREAQESHRGYVAEKGVSWRTSMKGFDVHVSGRIDGLYPEAPGRWVVEELKSWVGSGVQMELTALPPKTLEAYEWQCSLYMHFWMLNERDRAQQEGRREESVESVSGCLVLMDVLDGSLTRLPVAYDAVACARFVEKRLQDILATRAWELERQRAQEELARSLTFPFPGYRLFQQDLVDNVEGALDKGLALGLSAPTGIGKTAAALFPSLGWSLENGQRLFFVTAKVSQQELALDTLEKLIGESEAATAVQIEAKERSCPQEEMLCVPRSCPRLKDAATKLAVAGLPARLLSGGVVRAERIREEAQRAGVCPFELSLAAAYGAEVLVGDLNYGFHPGSRLKRLMGKDSKSRRPRPFCLVVDEAHNLYPRALDFLSPRLERRRVHELAEGCAHGPNPLYRELLESLLGIEDQFDGVADELRGGPWEGAPQAVIDLSPEPWAEIGVSLEIWLLDYLAYIKSGGRRPLPFVPRRQEGSRRVVDPAIQFCLDYFNFVETAERRGEEMVAVWTGGESPGDSEIQIHCLDPSRYLSKRLADYNATITMSATLEPLDFYLDCLGMQSMPHASCAFPSPFPAENRLLLVDEGASTRYVDRAKSLPRLASNLVALAAARQGVHLAFFPGYEYMASAGALLKLAAKTSGQPVEVVLVKSANRAAEVLQQLRQITYGGETRPHGVSKLVCTVMGGVLSEGVDYPGEMAVGAYIVGPGLPSVTFERRLMLEYHEDRSGQGFEHAYIHPGLTRVVQAAGRVIRSEKDRGVVVLVGERFAEARYKRLLPGYWQEEMVVTEAPVAAAKAFWSV